MSAIKERAGRFRRVYKDETFQEIMRELRDAQVGVFTDPSATIESINESHDMIKCLAMIERHIQAALDDEAVEDRKQN